MNKTLLLLAIVSASLAEAQIKVDPPAVNVNAQGASTVFLSYGSVRADQYSVEALWCADLVPAAPDIGMKCDPARTWGRLPLRNDLSRPSGSGGFTDIMTIPQDVARRAYQRASSGGESGYYYVRRFASASGQPDEYIPILLRLTGGGAGVPLALTDVKLRFSTEKTVLSTPAGQPPPPLYAELVYTGTGRLKGRWEVVLPGDEPPSAEDLVPEASLPVEFRSSQHRYTELARFDLLLPPTGRYRLDGPDVTKLPTAIDGLYQILLRIEATDDAFGTTDLDSVGSGSGSVTAGGVAGFSLPALRYYVGSSDAEGAKPDAVAIALLAPKLESTIAPGAPLEFGWTSSAAGASYFKLELIDAQGSAISSAIVAAPATTYSAPPFVPGRIVPGKLSWKVTAFDADGKEVARSVVSTFNVGIDAGSSH